MNHLISSCHMLALATDCVGSGAELPDTGLTWTHSFFKVFVMSLAFRCNPGSTGLWRGESKTTSPLGSPWEASGDVLVVLHGPRVSAPLVPRNRRPGRNVPAATAWVTSLPTPRESGGAALCPCLSCGSVLLGPQLCFVVLWRTPTLQRFNLGPGTSGKTDDISCGTSTWYKYDMHNVMHSLYA